MDVGARVELSSCFDESLDKFIVLLAADSLLPQPKIKIIIQEFLIVCTTVQDNWQAAVGMNAGAQSVEDKFGNGDENAAHTLITDAEDFLSVCGH
jgi:hypothetical protein